jgi:hypothetical protein
MLRGKNRGRLLLSEDVTLTEIASRLGHQAQENLAATANPGHHSRAGQIYATAGASLVRGAPRSCHENVTQIAGNGGKCEANGDK